MKSKPSIRIRPSGHRTNAPPASEGGRYARMFANRPWRVKIEPTMAALLFGDAAPEVRLRNAAAIGAGKRGPRWVHVLVLSDEEYRPLKRIFSLINADVSRVEPSSQALARRKAG